MSGHSKWSKVKHQKATTDVVKGKVLTKASQAITLAVKQGGGITDPEKNFRLRLAIDLAKSVNAPKENIERAIARAKGENGDNLEEVVYEAYGPHGVALIIESATNNRNRTVSQIKNVLDRHGGSLGTPGSVAYMFKQMGRIVVSKDINVDTDTMFQHVVAAGAMDLEEYDDVYVIYTVPQQLKDVHMSLKSTMAGDGQTEIMMKPTIPVTLNEEQSEAIQALIDGLEELDDVQQIYANTSL